jgi:hypothetical protein
MELISINNVMGYGIFIGLEPKSVSDKIIDTMHHQQDRELWLLGRLHVVISKESGRTSTTA